MLALALALVTLMTAGSCASGGGTVRMAAAEFPEPGAESQPEDPGPEDPGPEDPGPEDPDPIPPPPPPPPPATCIPTHAGDCVPAGEFEAAAEALAPDYRSHRNFQTQWGLEYIGAEYAYAHLNQLAGATATPGAGVTIGFIDSGIDQGHPDFAGKTITEVLVGTATDETGVSFSHGTAVASVAAGIRSLQERSAHGVAWGADIAMFAIPVGSGGGDYVPITLQQLATNDRAWGELFDHVLAWRRDGRGVAVLNLSIGFNGLIDGYSEQELRDNFGSALAAMAQAGAADKTILVWAAGNAHGDPCDPAEVANCVNGRVNAVSVEIMPGLAARIPELQGHSIAVVALSRNGQIASFSNRCGIAAGNCIAAPGEQIRSAYFGPHPDNNLPARGYADVQGTSVAAPFVAGGLAVMKQLFRDQLSNTELVARLFATANNEGIYADRSVYGHGAMDLRAATWPVGVLDVPVGGTRVDGPAIALATTRLRAGAALGDAIERSLSGREIAAFDALGAPFWFDLGGFTATAARMRAETHQRFVAPPSATPRAVHGGPDESSHWSVGFAEQPAGVDGGHLALAGRAPGLTVTDRRMLTATAFTTEGGRGPTPVSGAALAWQPAKWPVALRAGWMREPESVLASTGHGAFGALAGETGFVGAVASATLGGWRLQAGAELGMVSAAVDGGIVAAVSPLTTSALSLQGSMPVGAGGELSLSVSQPLRVEQGRAVLALPTGRTAAGEVVHRAVTADLAPSGRQIGLAARWRQPLAVGELRLRAVVTHQPGHRAAAAPEFQVVGGWRWEY